MIHAWPLSNNKKRRNHKKTQPHVQSVPFSVFRNMLTSEVHITIKTAHSIETAVYLHDSHLNTRLGVIYLFDFIFSIECWFT